MSIHIDTCYPCVNCPNEISPLDEFCKFCGAKQPSLEGKLRYNVFYRAGQDRDFNERYGGGIILTLEDIQELASTIQSSEVYEYYVGSYKTIRSIDEDTFECDIVSWMKITNGHLGEDQGSRRVIVTMLE